MAILKIRKPEQAMNEFFFVRPHLRSGHNPSPQAGNQDAHHGAGDAAHERAEHFGDDQIGAEDEGKRQAEGAGDDQTRGDFLEAGAD